MKIVILSFNHPELTERTLQSALQLVPNSQVLLVHNGSLIQHQTSLQKKFPQIEHLVLTENKGYTAGANAGLRRAFEQTDWVLFLTNDCQLLKFQKPPGQPAMVAPLIWARKIGKVDSIGGAFDVHRAHLSHCKSLNEFENSKLKYLPGTAFWIHREIFSQVGGFDESLEMFWEDVDLSVRTQEAGFALLADPQTEILHAVGKSTRKDTHYTTYLFQRNRKRISLKYASSPQRVYFNLTASWSKMFWFHLRKGNWERVSLLGKAIRDR